MAEGLRAQARQMFHWWHRVRDGTLTHASFRTSMQPVRREVERLLEVGQTCDAPKTEGTCRELLTRRQALWTFVRHTGVEPTNHAAERPIRPSAAVAVSAAIPVTPCMVCTSSSEVAAICCVVAIT